MVNTKKHLKIFLLLFVIISILVSLPITVYACSCDGTDEDSEICSKHCKSTCTKTHAITEADYCTLCGHLHDYDGMAGIEESAYNAAVQANGDVFNFTTAAEKGTVQCTGKDASGNQCTTQVPVGDAYCPTCYTPTGADFTIESILAFDVNGSFAPIFNAAETLYQSISVLGALMVFIYFLLEIAEVQMNDGFTYETLTRHTIHTILALLMIRNGFEIAKACINFANVVMAAVTENAKGNVNPAFTSSTCPYREAVGGMLYLNPIGMTVYYAIPKLVMTICFLIIRVICWSRVLDIMIRIIMAPVGMSDMMHNGSNSNGLKYLKKLIASLIQGACIVGTVMCYNELCVVIRGGVSGFIGAIVLGLALVTMMKQTADIANDIMGL